MKKRTRLLVLFIVLPGAFLLLLVLLGPLRIYANKGTETSPLEFTQARERWDSRTFSGYRMATSYWSNAPHLGECRQEVEVQNEKVVTVLSGTCGSNWKLSITDIFDLFEPFVGTDPIQRSPSGPCGYFVVDAVYDERYGYPVYIESREFQGIAERGKYVTYRTPACWQSLPGFYRVTVDTLLPLP